MSSSSSTSFLPDSKPKNYNPDSLDMNRVLNGLSYIAKDYYGTNQKSIIPELPNQESSTVQLTMNNIETKDILGGISRDIPPVYPSPLPTYDAKRCPPDISKAYKHKSAHEVAPLTIKSISDEICESTGLPVITNRLGLCCSMNKLYHLGPVVPMYFLLLKQMAFVLFLLSIITLAILISHDDLTTFSYESIMKALLDHSKQLFVLVLSLFSLIIVLFFITYAFRRSQKRTKIACKKSVTTPSDYSIMASHIGTVHVEEEIKGFFSNYVIPGYSLDVSRIAITYDIENYVDKIRELNALINEKKEAEKVGNYIASGLVEEIQIRIDKVSKYFENNKKAISGYRSFKRNGLCFVSFGTKAEAKSVRRKFEFSVLERFMVWLLEKCTDEFPEYFFKEHYMKVQKAPELNEIIWENLNCNVKRRSRGIFNSFIYMTVLASSTTSITYLSIYNDLFPGQIFVIALILAIFNEIIAGTVSLLCRYGKYKTTTEFAIAVGRRTISYQLINTAIPIIVIDVFIKKVTSDVLAADLLVISLITSLLPLLIRIINIPYLVKKAKRNGVISKTKSNSSSCGITQEEANSAFESPEFNVYRQYADSVRVLLFSCLCFCLSPGIAVIGFFTLVLGHFIDKYNLLRKSLKPTSMRSEIAEAMFEFIDLSILLLAIGCNFFIQIKKGTSATEVLCNTLSIFAMILSTIYLTLPHQRFSRSCFSSAKKMFWPQMLHYHQAREYFLEDYLSTNPVWRDKSEGNTIRDNHKAVLQEFKTVEVLNEAPELIPLFDYVKRRPSLAQAGRGKWSGLRNSYYSFPENYGYGDIYLSTKNLLMERSASMSKGPFVSMQPLRHIADEENDKQFQKLKMSEMVSSSSGSQGLKDERSQESQNSKGNSIMKDIMILSSFQSKVTESYKSFAPSHDIKLSAPSQQRDYFLPEFGTSNISTGQNMQRPNLYDGISPIDSGAIAGISPITGAFHKNENKNL